MITIKVYTNKQFADIKNAFGIIDIDRDGESLCSQAIALKGPTTVSAATAALALAGLRTIGNIDEVVVFKSNRNFFSAQLGVKDNAWATKVAGPSASYVFMLREAIEARELTFDTKDLDDGDVEEYKATLVDTKKKLKDGMARSSENSTNKS